MATKPFDNVWTWGNPLLTPPQSDAATFDNAVNDRTLSTVVQRNFWRSRRAWLKMLDQMETHEDELVQIALLEREAIDLKMNPAQYIANRIHKSTDTVYRLFALIDMRILAEALQHGFAESSNFLPLDSVTDTTWKPTPEMIQRKRLSVPRMCAAGMPGCAAYTTSGNYPLCPSCAKHFPMDKQDQWEARTRQWLLPEIRRIENEHRNQVIEILYEEHNGMMEQDVNELADFVA